MPSDGRALGASRLRRATLYRASEMRATEPQVASPPMRVTIVGAEQGDGSG